MSNQLPIPQSDADLVDLIAKLAAFSYDKRIDFGQRINQYFEYQKSLKSQKTAQEWAETILATSATHYDQLFLIACVLDHFIDSGETAIELAKICRERALITGNLQRLYKICQLVDLAHFKRIHTSARLRPDYLAQLLTIKSETRTLLAQKQQAPGFLSYKPKENRKCRRIVMVVGWIAAVARVAHLRQMLNYSSALFEAARAAGDDQLEIKLVQTCELSTSWTSIFFQGAGAKTNNFIRDYFAENLNPEDKGRFTFETIPPWEYDFFKQWNKKLAQTVIDFDADVVLRWHGVHGASYLIPPLFMHFPVISLQFIATLPPDPSADILLHHSSLKSSAFGTDPRVRRHHVPRRDIPKHLTYKREDFDLTESDTVLVTALSGDRLKPPLSMMTLDNALDLTSLLDADPHLKWCIVGGIEADTILSVRPEFEAAITRGQIKAIGLVDDLRAFHAISDVYCNLPKSHGGGMGIAMAISEGKPALCFEGTDACNFLEPTTYFEHWDDWFNCLKKVLASKPERQKIAKIQLDNVKQHHNLLTVGQELFGYISEAQASAKDRLAATRATSQS